MSHRNHKRHCMVVHAYYPKGETRVERQAMALLERDIEVDVICLRLPGQPATDTVDGVHVYRLSLRRYKRGSFAVQLFEYLAFFVLSFICLTKLHRKRRYNIVQVHNLPDFLVFVALIPKLTGARVILDLHDLMPEFYAERFGRPVNSLSVCLVRWQEWLSCCFADHIITVTELWRQTLIGRGQPPDKVTVVMNVADDRIFHLSAATDVNKSDSGFCLIYHGAMAPRHGIDLVLRAINLIRQAAPNIHLTLHGGASYHSVLQGLVNELGINDYVRLTARFVPTAELPKLLKEADLGVVPYRNGVFTGGILPTKLMEYAALGIPVIAARTPAIATYFDDAAVLFFAPGDVQELAQCILTLYHDRARLADLAHNITRFNEQYSWPDQRANYLQLVDRLSEYKG